MTTNLDAIVIDNHDPGDDALAFEGAVQYRVDALRIQREAKRRLDEETRPAITLPPIKNLTNLLDEPDSPTRYLIESLAPTNARVMLSAQYKAGKTTILHCLVRSLVDGEPFLGRFAVNTPTQRLALIDDELSEDMLRRWLRAQGIRNTDAVVDPVSLRGRVGLFDIRDDRTREAWARRFRDLGCDYLLLDCLRPVLDALGLDENHDAGTFLVAFDALLADAGIRDATLVHHMGHAGERTRGDARLLDWPDAIWKLVRESEDPNSARYFSATGRDVNLPEGRLGYDPATRHLAYAAGSRTDSKVEAAQVAVIKLLSSKSDEPLSKHAIETELADEHTQKSIRSAIARAVETQIVAIENGARGAKLHRIAQACQECGTPVTTGGVRHESCRPSPGEGALQ
jgi:AAA domain